MFTWPENLTTCLLDCSSLNTRVWGERAMLSCKRASISGLHFRNTFMANWWLFCCFFSMGRNSYRQCGRHLEVGARRPIITNQCTDRRRPLWMVRQSETASSLGAASLACTFPSPGGAHIRDHGKTRYENDDERVRESLMFNTRIHSI